MRREMELRSHECLVCERINGVYHVKFRRCAYLDFGIDFHPDFTSDVRSRQNGFIVIL
jgi:hypothetical protein